MSTIDNNIDVSGKSTYLTVSPSTAIIRLINFWFGLLGDLKKNSLRSSNIIHKSIKSLTMFTTAECGNKHYSYMPRLLLYSLFICEQNI